MLYVCCCFEGKPVNHCWILSCKNHQRYSVDSVLHSGNQFFFFLHSNPNFCTNQLEICSYLFYHKQFQNCKIYNSCAFRILEMFLFLMQKVYQLVQFNIGIIFVLQCCISFQVQKMEYRHPNNKGGQLSFIMPQRGDRNGEYLIVLLLVSLCRSLLLRHF